MTMSTTLIPLLYQTRTLQRLPRVIFRPFALRNLSQFASSRAQQSGRPWQSQKRNGPDAIPFELPDDVKITEEEVGEPPEPEEGRTTITPTERDAFEQIFQEIAARSNGRRPRFGAQPGKGRERTSAHPANVIIQDAARGYTTPQEPSFTATDRAEALQRFPPSLRRAAMLALGLKAPGEHDEARNKDVSAEAEYQEDDDASMESSPSSLRNMELRHQEQSRVESRMSGAETDFELWDIIEEEVFSMVEKLGIDSGQRSKRKARKHSRKPTTPSENDELAMDVYGPLYPSLLLSGLHRLDEAFAKPSPLALAILPRIKQLGLASYVLGATTPFYNSLMSILWHRYHNVAAVISLWDEMHHAGLSYDPASLHTLEQARQSLEQYDGPFHEMLMTAEFEPAVQLRIRRCQSQEGIAET